MNFLPRTDLALEDCNDKENDLIEYEINDVKIQKIVMDIQTDTEYPNALRPSDNPGYNTSYKSE